MLLNELIKKEDAVKYLKENTELFAQSSKITASNLHSQSLSVNSLANNLILVEDKDNNKKVIFKQILPFVRRAAEDNLYVPLPKERIYSEYFSIKLMGLICPDYVPEIYLFDQENNILVIEYIDNFEILRSALIRGKKFNHLGKQLGEFLAKKDFFTSRLFLEKEDFNNLSEFFAKAKGIEVWDRFLFTDSLLEASNKEINPLLKEKIKDFREKKFVIREVEKIRNIFKSKKQCLVHSDLHTSNIFVSKNKIKIFDSEYAMYGPASYDMARLLANIILNYSSIIGMEYDQDKKEYQDYLLNLLEEIYNNYKDKYSNLVYRYSHYDDLYDDLYLEKYFKDYLYEVISLTACTIIMRIYDAGLCLDFKEISDLRKRAVGQGFIIELAEKIFANNKDIKTIKEFKKFVKKASLEYQVSSIVDLVVKTAAL
jgi:5-methylthioribose kinase